jgi:hypothetical protein
MIGSHLCPSFKARPYNESECDYLFGQKCFNVGTAEGENGFCPWAIEQRADSDDDGVIESIRGETV